VFDHGARPVAAVALTFPSSTDRRRRDRLGQAARSAAALVTARISGRGPSVHSALTDHARTSLSGGSSPP
jgi:hypothetical protein